MTSLSDVKSDDRINWYPTETEERIKIEEFFDFWQSAMNPAIIRTSQQNHFYKILFKREKKDEKLVEGKKRTFPINLLTSRVDFT